MACIGKLPINIPENVDINYTDSEVIVKGKFGTLETKIPDTITWSKSDNQLQVTVKEHTRNVKALHGLYRTLINNMFVGVSKQFDITLELEGVGYRAVFQGNQLVLSLYYSHPVKIKIPSDISVEVAQNTTLNLILCNKELLGLFAANIC